MDDVFPNANLADVFGMDIESQAIRLERFLGCWGNVTIEEVAKIVLICAWKKPLSVFEFGTYNGLTTLQMALNTPPHCMIHTLDIPFDSPEIETLGLNHSDTALARKTEGFCKIIGRYFHESPANGKIRQLCGNSLSFDFSPYLGKMDLVYVDAGHTAECIKADSQNAFLMLRTGGVVIWHNYGEAQYPEITECLAGYAREKKRIYHLRGTHLAVHWDGHG